MSQTLSAEMKSEVATIDKNPFAVIYNGLLRPNDATLATRGGAVGLKIYDEIERDCHAFSVLQKRKLALVARPVVVDPASTALRDRKAAQFVEAQLQSFAFDNLCLGLLDAILKGYAVSEIVWKKVEGRAEGGIGIAYALPREQRCFGFTPQREPRLLTRSNPWPGEAVPPRKFIVHRYGAKDGNPYGLGLGTRLFWPVWFKRQGIQFWLTFADKFGSPTAVGKYPTGATTQDRNTLLQALGALSQDSGVIIPEGMAIEFLEAARSGTVNTYESLCRYMDEEISKAVLGETLSTTMGGGSSSRAASQTHNSVRLELVQADADLLSDTLNASLIRWLVELNLPGAKPPRVRRDCAEPEDLKSRAERDKILISMGYKPSLQYIQQTYGEDWAEAPKPDSEKPDPAQTPALARQQPPNDAAKVDELAEEAAFAEGVDSARADQASLVDGAEALAGDYAHLLARRVANLLALLEQTQDLQTFREHLASLLADDASAPVQDALLRARFSAHLLGHQHGTAPAAPAP